MLTKLLIIAANIFLTLQDQRIETSESEHVDCSSWWGPAGPHPPSGKSATWKSKDYPDKSRSLNDNVTKISSHPVVVVISFDGFRFNFFSKTDTPNMQEVINEGVSVAYMRNQFVTKTFTNHMSIATGLHAETHGVVDNWFFDPKLNKTLNATSDEFWNFDNRTLPLWTLNEMAGEGRKSGVMMWPGSDFPYGPNFLLPFRVEKWNERVPFQCRIDRVLDWITDDKDPVNLVYMYFEEPDEYAHAYGPESNEVVKFIQKLDKATGYFVQKLKSSNIYDKVNLVFLSDHGFQEVRQQDMIDISNIVSKSWYKQYGSTPVIQILPESGKLHEVYAAFKTASIGRNFSVYRREDMPTYWHYSNSRRILPIILVADLGFVFDDFKTNIANYNTKFNLTPSPDRVYGVHGYDNHALPMHPFFISRGPRFKSGYMADPFENIDVFPLVCKILGISTPPNNGTLEHVENLLYRQRFSVTSPVGWVIGAGLIFGVTVLLGIMSLLVSNRNIPTKLSQNHDMGSYRYVSNRDRGTFDLDLTEERESETENIMLGNSEKEEYQALLMSSSTEELSTLA